MELLKISEFSKLNFRIMLQHSHVFIYKIISEDFFFNKKKLFFIWTHGYAAA